MIAPLLDRGLVPDPLVRLGIRRLLAARLSSETRRAEGDPSGRLESLRRELADGPIAEHTTAANEQHYELPPEFFERVLGARLKYSSAYWPENVSNLDQAEAAMLGLTAERARIEDGQRILDLGCGWGSLSLWIAERHPASSVLAVSNSHAQGEYLRRRARELGLANVEHRVADVNTLELDRRFDRIISVEMLEHVRRHEPLFERLAGWLTPDGELFVHVFCHRELAYPFEDRGPSDWMARHFFTGGLMPSFDLLPAASGPLAVDESWAMSGLHYARTAEAWLERLDARRDEILELFVGVYGWRDARRWLERWRVFFLACAELFAYRDGNEWQVAHYRFRRRDRVPG